jgi:hypothetical protein
MFVLGKCIRQLKEQGPISYRKSQLTHLFGSFFEPYRRPFKAAIVINCSPSAVQIDDTLFALQFAADAAQAVIRQVAATAGGDEEEGEEVFEEKMPNVDTGKMETLAMEHDRQKEELAVEKQRPSMDEAAPLEDELNRIRSENDQLAARSAELAERLQSHEQELEQEKAQAVEAAAKCRRLAAMVQEVQQRKELAQDRLDELKSQPRLPDIPVDRLPFPKASSELAVPPELPDSPTE